MQPQKTSSAAEPILVTGGAGYIGSHVVRDLGEQGFFPIVLDNLSTGSRNAVLYGEFHFGDCSDSALVAELIRRYQIKSVIHFAASIEVGESVSNPLKYYENNALNSFLLIKSCIENGIENFIFSSTAAVYGIPATIPVNEDAPLQPINPYGSAKLVTEMVLRDAAGRYGAFQYIALRYFNVAGADRTARLGQNYRNPTHLITRTLKTALGLFPQLDIFGTDYPTPDGTAIRDYIHIDDLASAHLIALDFLKKERRSRVFNCGYGKGVSVLEVVQAAKQITGIDISVVLAARRAGDPPALIADSSRLQRELGWVPRCNDILTIIKSAWAWENKLLQGKQP